MACNKSYTWMLLVLGTVAGCSRVPPSPSGTGAKEAVEGYYTAIFEKDWSKAYAGLHPQSQARYSSDQFNRLAENYRRNLGFEPEMVQVRSCEEHGTEAIAHVILKGQAAGKQCRYKDGVTLHRSETGWGIVVSSGFGQTRTP